MYTPSSEAIELLARPDFTDDLTVASADPTEFESIVVSSELALCDRFAVDRTKDNEPVLNFPLGSTLDLIYRAYDKVCSTRPKKLYIAYTALDETVDMRLVMPLAAMGKAKQAAAAQFSYRPTSLKRRGGHEVQALGRTSSSSSRIATNPFAEEVSPKSGQGGRISDRGIMYSRHRSGQLGGQRF